MLGSDAAEYCNHREVYLYRTAQRHTVVFSGAFGTGTSTNSPNALQNEVDQTGSSKYQT